MGFKGVQNPCDYIIYYDGIMYLLELKTTKNKTSIPLSSLTDYQIKELSKRSKEDGIVAGFVINFRETTDNLTYFVSGQVVDQIKDRKSISLEFCKANCISLSNRLIRVNHSYGIEQFLKLLGDKKRDNR